MSDIKYMFYCVDNLEDYTDSLLFDSETIATLKDDKGNFVSIKVTGEKRITYKEEEYRYASDYPDELIEIIKNGEVYDNEEVYIGDNNWFEIVGGTGNIATDGYVFEYDLSKLTKEELKSIMIEYLKYFKDEIND